MKQIRSLYCGGAQSAKESSPHADNRPVNTNGFPFRHWQQQVVREFAWACFSPGLMHDLRPWNGEANGVWRLPLTARRRRWLQQLERDPTPLVKALRGSGSRRLGHYFEQLWQFALQTDPDFQLVTHNLLLEEQGITLGELDAIVLDRRHQQYLHLELAVKFYLGITSPAVRWIGPNPADSLDRKLSRLCQHQLVLGQTPQGRAALTQRGVEHCQPKAVLRGWLFHPRGQALPLPAGASHRAQQGSWWYLRDWLQRMPGNDWRWWLLPRREWMDPWPSLKPGFNDRQLQEILRGHFEESHHAVMVVGRTARDQQQRCCIVPDHWPEGDSQVASR